MCERAYGAVCGLEKDRHGVYLDGNCVAINLPLDALGDCSAGAAFRDQAECFCESGDQSPVMENDGTRAQECSESNDGTAQDERLIVQSRLLPPLENGHL